LKTFLELQIFDAFVVVVVVAVVVVVVAEQSHFLIVGDCCWAFGSCWPKPQRQA